MWNCKVWNTMYEMTVRRICRVCRCKLLAAVTGSHLEAKRSEGYTKYQDMQLWLDVADIQRLYIYILLSNINMLCVHFLLSAIPVAHWREYHLYNVYYSNATSIPRVPVGWTWTKANDSTSDLQVGFVVIPYAISVSHLPFQVLFGDTNGELEISTVLDFDLGGIGIFQIVCDWKSIVKSHLLSGKDAFPIILCWWYSGSCSLKEAT